MADPVTSRDSSKVAAGWNALPVARIMERLPSGIGTPFRTLHEDRCTSPTRVAGFATGEVVVPRASSMEHAGPSSTRPSCARAGSFRGRNEDVSRVLQLDRDEAAVIEDLDEGGVEIGV